jgi:hypothetical protein
MSPSSADKPDLQGETMIKKDHTLSIFIVCASLVMVISGGIGFLATSILLKLPRADSCPKIFWPLASASVRLYCAQLATQEKTVSGWVEAIKMVDNLPSEHNLRTEIDHNIEEWVSAILNQGETLFQSGKIDEAISVAEEIPADIPNYNLVEKQIEHWQAVWGQAERTEKRVEQYISTRNWNKAFREAAQLTGVENQYWSTVKYEETLNLIQAAKEESGKLESAYALLETGELDDLLKAIASAEKIESDSLGYQEAQELIESAKNQILKLIQAKIEARDWVGLETALNKISQDEKDLNENLNDWYQLANAGTSADQGTVESINKAITLASSIESRSPVYYEAQKLINRWEIEAEDVEILNEANQIAKGGTIEDLEKAIATVSAISSFHPRYEEAQNQINQWNRQIQIIEDRPYLEKAQRLAQGSTLNSWQEAINQARLITSNRPLYPEAQKIIQQSVYKIQVTEDRPVLDQAIRLASQEDWYGAIAKAKQITSGRALYGEAQQKINTWQVQINAQQSLEEAYRLAADNTVSGLTRAIQLVSQIPSYTTTAKTVQPALNEWSEALLILAEDTSNYDYDEAIAIAQQIPRGSSAYNSARTFIEIWKRKKNTSSLDFPDS